MKHGLVSIVIPTKNSDVFLESTLKSIRNQSYASIEIIIVDGKSTDRTLAIAKKYGAAVMTYAPKVKTGIFDAPHKRNYGMARGKGEYVYWLDADMELPRDLIREAVSLTKKRHGGVVLPEDSVGVGLWAGAKQLERRCYWGDSSVESPRFFPKRVWDEIGGFDLSLGAGGDDIDLTQKLLERGYTVGRTKSIVRHNEGSLSITRLFKKRFMYGREMVNYLKKRPTSWLISYNPVKPSYFRNWRLFMKNPKSALLLVIMRTIEYAGGISGLIYSLFERSNQQALRTDNRDYSDYSSQYYGAAVPSLLKKYMSGRPYKTVADVGCGDGSLLFALRNEGYLRGKMTYAIDLSPKSIKLVKKIDPSIRAFVDNVENIARIPKSSVDFCISTMVIEHVDDHKLLRSVSKILRRKATLYITTVFKKWYGWYFYRRNGKWVMDVTHEREYTDDAQLLRLVIGQGFSILETRKRLIWFPVVDFFARRFHLTDRALFANNPVFHAIRKFTIPIPGYYEWELVLTKM